MKAIPYGVELETTGVFRSAEGHRDVIACYIGSISNDAAHSRCVAGGVRGSPERF